MTNKCECDLAGFCKRRGCELPNIHFQKCKAGQVKAIDTLYHFEPSKPERKGLDINRRATTPKIGVGTQLKAKISGLLEIKSGGTCGCNTLAKMMDKWGPDECEVRRDYIIGRLMENKQMLTNALSAADHGALVNALSSVAGWVVGSGWVDPAIRAGANWFLTESIRETREMIAAAPQPRRFSKTTIRSNPGRGKRNGNAFRHISGPIEFVSSARFQQDILTLVGKIPPDTTAIAGVARSGLSVATMVSMYLHLPMLTIRQTMNDVVPTGNGWRLGGSKHIDPKADKIVIIDDTVMTGNSLKAIKPLVDQEFSGTVLTAAVYVNPLAAVKPDIWTRDLQWPHLLEWNVFNSVLSPSMALDFDGILCHNPHPYQDDDGEQYINFINNAIPLYTPRRVPIPLIVTARIEKYREQTEAWLRKHNISWHRLVMHPASTLAERNRDDIAAYKANHYAEWARTHRAAPGPIMFFESEDWQARRIGAISGLLAVCPATAGVYS
jgi:adenine/guanine phosphoribosyltransferase-like PRPP-binding protein